MQAFTPQQTLQMAQQQAAQQAAAQHAAVTQQAAGGLSMDRAAAMLLGGGAAGMLQQPPTGLPPSPPIPPLPSPQQPAPAPAPAAPPPPGTVRLDIEVPEGANVGDRLTFNTAAGQFSLVVPIGAAPGKKMMVTMPVPANFQSNQQLAISSLRINGNAVVPASARQQSIGGGVPQNSSISGTALQNATDQARSQRQRQVEASIASARQGLACINADLARFMCMDINANPVLARKRDEKVAELLARRAQVEDLVAQLLKKLDNDEPPPGWTAEQRETSTGRKYKVPAVSS